MRIVSLLPSATEIIRRLDAEGCLVACTHECEAPDSVPVLIIEPTGSEPRTRDAERLVRDPAPPDEPNYMLDTHRLLETKPDLIIFGSERTDATALEQAVGRAAAGGGPAPALLALRERTIEDVLDNVLRIGGAIGLEARALDLVMSLRGALFSAQEFVPPFASHRPVVGFIEWAQPLVVAGHWRVQMIERAGGVHPWNPTRPGPGSGAAAGPQQAQRLAGAAIAVTPEAFAALGPEMVVVAPRGASLDEAFQVGEALLEQPWFESLPAAVHGRVAVVDGRRCFHCPGPGIVDGLRWLVGWIQDRPHLMDAIEWKPLTA
ncbi:MAG: cobalamin-binding protein [Phycisphaerales bacterium]